MMVEERLKNKIVEAVKGYLVRWGFDPTNVRIGANIRKGDDSLSVRAFVDAPMWRINVEYVGPSLKGVPQGFSGYANFAVVERGERKTYIFLDDGFVMEELDGKRILIEIVPSKSVVPIFRYV